MAYNAFTAPLSLTLAPAAYPLQPFRGLDELDLYPIEPIYVTVLGSTPKIQLGMSGGHGGANLGNDCNSNNNSNNDDNFYGNIAQPHNVQNFIMSTTNTDKHPLFVPALNKLRNHINATMGGSIVGTEEQYKRIYVGGLDNDITKELLGEIFKSFGPIESIEIHTPRPQVQSYAVPSAPSYAFIQYDRIGSVFDALICMHNYRIRRKPLRVSYTESIKKHISAELPSPQHCDGFMKTNLGPYGVGGRANWNRAVDVGVKLGLVTDPEPLYNLYGSPQYGILSETEAKEILSGGNDTAEVPLKANTKVFVGGNFGQEVGESQLFDIFSSFGTVLKINLIPGLNGGHRGYGFIDFEDDISAERACTLNGHELGGKKLVVTPAKTGPKNIQNAQNNPHLANSGFNLSALTQNQIMALNYNGASLEDRDGSGNSRRNEQNSQNNDPNGQNRPNGPNSGDNSSNLIQFEFDYNSLVVPDPLLSRYPSIAPIKSEMCVYPCVKITNLIDVVEWKNLEPDDREQFCLRLIRDFSIFGIIQQGAQKNAALSGADGSNVSGRTSNNDDFIMVVNEEDIVRYGQSMLIKDNQFETHPDDGNKKESESTYCSFFIKFTSPLMAKRCVTVLNNRYFYGRPITASYCLNLPVLHQKPDPGQPEEGVGHNMIDNNRNDQNDGQNGQGGQNDAEPTHID